jgi:catechol 2,3-dioxygenase-like lactoylglutathione lyase family enzyme
MIDHISIGVRDFERAVRFYEAVLATLGITKLVVRADTVGFGKKYPDFWLNRRGNLSVARPDDGLHVCLRARSEDEVRAFHAAALAAGGTSDGAPGLRPEYTPNYYAAFVCDPEGNRIEALNFTERTA